MKQLTRNELRQISAGAFESTTCPKYQCQCNGTGTWTATYCSAMAIIDDINAYCSNGGTCSAMGDA